MWTGRGKAERTYARTGLPSCRCLLDWPIDRKAYTGFRSCLQVQYDYNTRQLSYRKEDPAMRPIYGCLKNFESPDLHTATFPELCNGRLFRSTLRTCVQNWKFVALPVPEIIGGTPKNSAVPEYAHAPFSPKFLMGFCSDGPRKPIPAKFEVRSFTRSWDNRGYSRNWAVRGYAHAPFSPFLWAYVRMDSVNASAKFAVHCFSPWIRPRSLFSQIFNGLLFTWTLWIYLPNLKFIALRIPEIIGGIHEDLGSPWTRPRSLK